MSLASGFTGFKIVANLCRLLRIIAHKVLSLATNDFDLLLKFTFHLPIEDMVTHSVLCSVYSFLRLVSALIWLWERYITVLQLDHRLRLHSINVCCQSAKTKMCPRTEAHIALFNLGLSHLHCEHTVTAG